MIAMIFCSPFFYHYPQRDRGVPPPLTLFGLSIMFLVVVLLCEEDERESARHIRVIEFDTPLFFRHSAVGRYDERDRCAGLLVRVYEVMPTTAANYVMGLLSLPVDNAADRRIA